MSESRATAELRIYLLGDFHVALGDNPIPADAWRLSKARSLFKLLALAPNHRLHREQIFDLLWPHHGEEAALNNLHSAIYAIRRALGASAEHMLPAAYLRLEQAQLVLCPEAPLWTDVQAFESATARAREATDPAIYEAALALYTADLLPDDRNEEWTISRRERLRSSYDALLLAAVHLYETAHDYAKAVGALEQIVVHDPAHEQACRHLMRLYALQDQRHLALRCYQLLKDALRQELDVEPARATLHLYEDILAERFPPVALQDVPDGRPRLSGDVRSLVDAGGTDAFPSPHPSRRTLPGHAANRTRLIGREAELATLRELLDVSRLLTLVGGDGCGKSRLARRLAADLHDTFPNGVHIVDLAPFGEPFLVTQAVARAVGMRDFDGHHPAGRLVEYLRDKDLLLLLDHCDHQLPSCRRLIAALLAQCPDLQILATSREAFALPPETVWQVPPLSMPKISAPPLAALRRADAVRHFLAGGRIHQPGLTLTDENATAIERLCRHLRGNPLAIELVTAHLDTVPLEALVATLETLPEVAARPGVPADTTPVNAVLAWSHRQLGAAEQVLLRRLAVFIGNWGREAAIAVCVDQQLAVDMVPDALARLVDRSLVIVDGAARYRMLAPVRRFAAERLAAADESTLLRQRHAEHYLAVAEQATQALAGRTTGPEMERLGVQHDNLRVALQHALLSGSVELSLRLAAVLWPFWSTQGYLSEGHAWLKTVLSVAEESPSASPALQAQVLYGAGVLAELQGEDAYALARHQEALTLYRREGDQQGIASALTAMADIARRQDDARRSLALYSEALPLLEALRDHALLVKTLETLGNLHAERGEHAQARPLYERALALFEALGDTGAAARMLCVLGEEAARAADYQRAVTLHTAALARVRALSDAAAIAGALRNLATLAQRQGNAVEAATLLEEAQALGSARDDRESRVGMQRTPARLTRRPSTPERALAAGAENEQIYHTHARVPGAATPGVRHAAATAEPAAYRACPPVSQECKTRASITRCLECMAEITLSPAEPAHRAARPGTAAPSHVASGHDIPAAPAGDRIAEPPPIPFEAGTAAREPLLMERRSLSPREREIAQLAALGKTNNQIAATLGIAERTVDTHVVRIFKKLQISARGRIVETLDAGPASAR